jgi:hypothetical protein
MSLYKQVYKDTILFSLKNDNVFLFCILNVNSFINFILFMVIKKGTEKQQCVFKATVATVNENMQ